MSLDIDALVSPSIVAVLDDQKTLGTGFVIDDRGGILTCHHVIDGIRSLWVRDANGIRHKVDPDHITLAPHVDLALIRLSVSPGPSLAISDRRADQSTFWTKGFHRESDSLPQAFPVAGIITGRTTVNYHLMRDYRIDDVFVLQNGLIDHGLSGAPLLDPQSKAVVGVVNTRLTREHGGFAIPMQTAAGSPELCAAVLYNRQTVPAWGPHINHAALRVLCQKVNRSKLDELATLHGVDLDRHIPRSSVAQTIEQFLASNDRILALVGPSGMGKSTEIAAIAQRESARCLLLLGSDVKEGCQSLNALIDTTFRAFAASQDLPCDLSDRLPMVLNEAERPTIFLLDALNGTHLDWQKLRGWMSQSYSALRQSNAKLVLTTRPECWEVVRDTFRRVGVRDTFHHVVVQQLAAFDDQERAAAQRMYRVKHYASSALSRLPLAFALARPSVDQQLNEVESLDVLVERLLTSASIRASAASKINIAPEAVMQRLRQLGAQLIESDSGCLPTAVTDVTFGNPQFAESLVEEGVLARTSGGYRFVHDDVADWLKGAGIDLQTELRNLDNQSRQHSGAIASALREVGRQSGIAQLSALLNILIDKARVRETSVAAIHLLEETLLKMGDAEPLLPTLRALTKIPQYDYRGHEHLNLEFWRSVPVSSTVRLDLIRELIPGMYYYGWRTKDWDKTGIPDALHNPAALALAVCDEDPTAITALGSWLEDKRRLDGNEADVADVARGILYRLRHSHSEAVWHAADRFAEHTFPVWWEILRDDPHRFVARITASRDAVCDELYVAAILRLPWSELADTEKHALIAELESRYRRGLSEELVGTALFTLARYSSNGDYYTQFVTAYREDRYGIPPSAIAVFSDKSAEIALRDAISGGGARALAAISVLGHTKLTALHEFADEAVLGYLLAGIGDVDATIRLYAEFRMWNSHVAGTHLKALVRHLIADRDVEWSDHMVTPLVSAGGLRDDQASRSRLLHEFLATADNSRMGMLLDTAIFTLTYQVPVPDLTTAIAGAMAVVDPDELACTFLERGRFDKKVASYLGAWLADDTLPARGPWLSSVRDRVRIGQSPAEAFKLVFDEWRMSVLD
ncbi:trypsin-like peptidase domain-containing protein [Mycobacteroides chelonae]